MTAFSDDRSDLERRQRPSKVLQTSSGELAPGPNRLDAAPGDIVAYFPDGSLQVFSRITGMLIVAICFVLRWVEWPRIRSTSGPIDSHIFKPPDTNWIVDPLTGRKVCIRASTSTKIEETIYLNALVEGKPIVFPFKSTALDVGREMEADADRVRVLIDGSSFRVIGCYYTLSSEQEKDGSNKWQLPTFGRGALFGEQNGPPIELMRQARDMRVSLVETERSEKQQARLAAPGVVTPTPPLLVPRASTSFTTGTTSWSSPKLPEPPPPPPPGAKPPDDIPWQ
jgi:hypothetical protein